MHPSLMSLAFRRTLWPAILMGGLAVGWVLWSGSANAGSALAAWSHAPGVLRYAIWMTGLLVAGPLLIGQAAALGHRLGGADAAWCASRPASRLAVLASSWAGAALAGWVWILLLAATAELGAGPQERDALQPVGMAELSPIAASGSDVVSWEVDAPLSDDATVLRLPVGLIATGGPSARIRVRLTRAQGGESIERELLVATTRPVEVGLPSGEGPLRLELERLGDGALVLVPAQRAQWWRAMESAGSASLLLTGMGLLISQALLALALALGVWMRPAAATALVLAVGVALWFSSGPIGGWGAVMEHVAGGDVPGSPSLLGAGVALMGTIIGMALAWSGLRWGARA